MQEEIIASLMAGDRAQAANAAFRAHGPDVYRFLAGILEPRLALEAYRSTVELATAEIREEATSWPLSVWLYAIARRAALQCAAAFEARGAAGAHAPADAPITTTRRASERTHTPELRRGAARLRDSLTLEQRVLLALRVARGLSWSEIALVQLGARVSPSAHAARSRALRSEFRLLRNALKIEAVARGILPDET